MIEFEKWWEKASKDRVRYDATEDEYVAKDGWKFALEWVLSLVDQSNSDGSIIQSIKSELRS